MSRGLRAALFLAAGLVLGAAGWEALENLSLVPFLWSSPPEPRGRARNGAYEVVSAGAAVVELGARAVTLRAWAPSMRAAVTPLQGAPITVTIQNLPRRARLGAAPGVSERVSGSDRVLSGPDAARWEFHYDLSRDDLRFAVVGDTGASRTFEQALRTAAGLEADFAVVVGDLAYSDRDIPRLRALLTAAPLPVYVGRGNHDYASGARRDFIGPLAPPYYAFAFGGAAFVVLDTGREFLPGLGVDSGQHEWLRRTLADPLGSPVFVFMHKPPLRRHPEAFGHAMWDRPYARALVRDFERAGVRMVFAGHLHEHDTWERRGVTYVITGEGKTPRAGRPQMAVVDVQAGIAHLRFVPIWPEGPQS